MFGSGHFLREQCIHLALIQILRSTLLLAWLGGAGIVQTFCIKPVFCQFLVALGQSHAGRRFLRKLFGCGCRN